MENLDGDLRSRLQQAALALFRERGYDKTTAAEIAARTGVTERTFFRHFPDKREVLFDGEAVLSAALLAAISDSPVDLAPLDTLFHAFRSVVGMLEKNRPFSKPRHDLISSTPALHEREMAKMHALADKLAGALKERGVPDLAAVLAARTGMGAFAYATVSWLDDPTLGLAERLDITYRELKSLIR